MGSYFRTLCIVPLSNSALGKGETKLLTDVLTSFSFGRISRPNPSAWPLVRFPEERNLCIYSFKTLLIILPPFLHRWLYLQALSTDKDHLNLNLNSDFNYSTKAMKKNTELLTSAGTITVTICFEKKMVQISKIFARILRLKYNPFKRCLLNVCNYLL